MKIIISIFKWHLKIIYFFIKLFTIQKDKIVIISRQSNSKSLDILMIEEELRKRNRKIAIKTICLKMESDFKKILKNKINKIFEFYFHLYKQMYHIATSKVVLIDGYCIPVSILTHKKNTYVIQLWHALGAIKKFGYQSVGLKQGKNKEIAESMNMHKNYNLVISGSNAMNVYFKEAFNIEEDKLLAIGTPKVDYLLSKNYVNISHIYSNFPVLKKKKNILYVPTFRTNNNYKMKELYELIDFNKYNFIVKLHPETKIELRNEIMTCSNISSIDLLYIADYIITDYSAISIEASILEKPILFYVYDYEEYKQENGLNINLFDEFPNNTFKNPKDLVKSLNTKYDINNVKKFKQKFVSNLNGDSTIKICNLIENRICGDDKCYKK